MSEEKIVCERATGRPRCTVEVNGLVSSETTAYDDLTGVRAIEHETRDVWYMLFGLVVVLFGFALKAWGFASDWRARRAR